MANQDHIPFVYSREDCEICKKFYSDSAMVRVSLPTKEKTSGNLPDGPGLWVDGGVDGLDRWKPGRGKAYEAYDKYISQFHGYDKIADPFFQKSPRNDVLKQFVESVLNQCLRSYSQAKWLAVPQLPMVSDSSRNEINRRLAQTTASWKATSKYMGRLILPVIFTHQKQVNLKSQGKGTLVRKCYELAGSDGVWVADATLNDQEGSGPLDKRFQGLVRFHRELAECLPSDAIKVAGPYWGMNLVLWARGFIQYPAIGLGNAYQYRIPGPSPPPGKSRVAIGPLRRQAVASLGLRNWLVSASTRLPRGDPASSEFEKLARNLSQGLPPPRTQVAEIYKKWFDGLASVPLGGRGLALYQDLSKAFVLGRSLPPLPRDEKNRKPDRVAQQLMLNCL